MGLALETAFKAVFKAVFKTAFVAAFVAALWAPLGCERIAPEPAPSVGEPPLETGADPARSTDAATRSTLDDDAGLSVDPARIELGDALIPGTPVTHTVTLRNRGNRSIRVMKAVADCGCTTPTWPEQPIPAGGSAEADLKLDPPKTQGLELVKRVTFVLDEGEPLVVELVGRVGRFVDCTPTTLEGPADDDEAPAPSEIVLESADGTPFRVIAAEPLLLSELPRTPALRHAVTVDWRLWREKRKPVKFTITTDHPKAPPLLVVLRRPIVAKPDAPEAPR
ncbi:MAG: hypothetical protein RI967_1725 [Planctomycetota bacterium]